jgi:hypothetical protein
MISHRTYHHSRTSLDLGSTSNRTTLIIICTVASIGGIVLVLLFFRIFRIIFRLNEYRPSPLPPIQPLAHHRDQQLTQYRPTTWYDDYLSAPDIFASISGSRSDISLLHREPSRATGASALSPQASVGFSEHSDAMDEVTAHTPLALPPEFPESPIPDSAVSEGVESPFSPDTLQSQASSSRTHSSASSHITAARPRSQINSSSHLRVRPVSMSSIGSTALSSRTYRTSRTIRGPPHGPLSNVQIVLPAPLAPSLHMAIDNSSSKRHTFVGGLMPERSPSRLSVVDKWAQIPVRSARSERRSSSISEPRASTSSTSSRRSVSSPIHPRSVSEPLSSGALPGPQAPPVPRIPSIYNTPANIDPPRLTDHPIQGPELLEKGRAQATPSPSVSVPPSPSPKSPQGRPSKLQKQRPTSLCESPSSP